MAYDPIMLHIGEGLESARRALGALAGREVQVSLVRSCEVDLYEVPFLAGAPDRVVLASYVRFSGDFDGQVLILYRPDNARELARAFAPGFFAEIEGEETGALLDSLLCEISNILTAAALNAIADGTETTLRPTPPRIVRDMAGAILETVLTSGGLLSEKVPVVDVSMNVGTTEAGAEMIFLPQT